MKVLALFSFILLPVLLFSQVSVNGKISAGDSVDIYISSTAPSDFPKVEVLFRAEDLNKYPYWGLEKEDLKVYENEALCQVISLRHFSESEPINISLVLDHSGSMAHDYNYYLEFFKNDTTKMLQSVFFGEVPDIPSPLENAVSAIKGFLKNFNHSKDRIGLFAFDDTVSVQLKPKNDIAGLEPFMDALEPSGSTAFFDAVYLAIESLADLDGINVVIALTDGHDNASRKYSSDVIALSKERQIPVYCIGLGAAMQDTLEMLADATTGYYAYAKKSSALDSVYSLLNRKILAYYLMTYESPNWSSLDVTRDLTIEFEQSDVYVENNAQPFELPEAVVNYLKEKERDEFLYLVGGIAGGTAVIIGLTVFMLRRRSPKLSIERLFPNPGDGQVKLEIELGANASAKLSVTNLNGVEVYSEILSSNTPIDLDLTHLPKGYYVFVLTTDTTQSEVKKYIKQ